MRGITNKAEIFGSLDSLGHEQIIFCNEPEVGLKAIISIHSTARGPALGGCRMWPYTSELEALQDVLRLSRGMTYKSAVTGLPLGGGKAVIIGDPKKDKSKELFRAFGRFVESLNGRYITAEDVGVEMKDMDIVLNETQYVTGVSQEFGGSGDPAPFTAFGCLQGIFASVQHKLGRKNLKGLRVAVQGTGHVGQNLIRLLIGRGAEVIAADIEADKCREFCRDLGCRQVDAEEILFEDCEIFAPCAMGGILNEETIGQLRCEIVAGSANNQLLKSGDGRYLKESGILYAPDYAINAGGLLNVFMELKGYDRDRAVAQVEKIYETILEIYKLADELNLPTNEAADQLAEKRIEAARKDPNHIWIPNEHPASVHRQSASKLSS